MFNKKQGITISLTISILLICEGIESHEDVRVASKKASQLYVDPRSFTGSYFQPKEDDHHPDIHPHSIATLNDQQDATNSNFKCIQNNDDVPDELFSRKLINIILKSASFEENDHIVTGNIILELTKAELKKLQSFGNGETSIRDLDSMINEIFKKPEKSIQQDIISFMHNIVVSACIHKEVLITLLAVSYFTWIVLTTKWNIFKISGIIIVFLIAASFIITWIQLIKQEEIKLITKQMKHTKLPIHCKPETMTVWDTLMHIFSSEQDCHRYFEAVMENPFLKVTPAQALSHMIAIVIFQPSELLGKALGNFVHHSTEHMWGPLQVFISPILTILMIIFSIMALICLCGGSLGLNFGFFRLLSLTGPSVNQSNEKCCKGIRSPTSQDGQVREVISNITNTENAIITEVQSDQDRKYALEDVKPPKNDSDSDSDREKSEKEENSASNESNVLK